jgi:spermidine/putrescine transport system ATP-binding protein
MLIELDELHDKIGITFIYVTHDQQEALSVSDRIAVMNQGDVLQIGTPHEIYESPATDFVARFIGETNLFDGTVVSVEKLDTLALSVPGASADDHMVHLDIPELGRIMVTTVDDVKPGQRVSYTIRPEKIAIAKEKTATSRSDINYFQGMVDEPIYSGFQSKFYVRLKAGGESSAKPEGGGTRAGLPRTESPRGISPALIRVVKQHANYSDEGPGIVWKDAVHLSWSANDGYIVEIRESGDAAAGASAEAAENAAAFAAAEAGL